MIVHCAKSTCFVRSIYLHVSMVFITKQKSLGWSKTSKRKRTFRVRRIQWEKRPIKHTPSFQFEFVSRIVGSKSVALCFGFYGAQVRLHMNFQAHNQKSSRICDQLVANFEPCTSRGVLQQEKYERKERDTVCYMPVCIKSGFLMYIRYKALTMCIMRILAFSSTLRFKV